MRSTPEVPQPHLARVHGLELPCGGVTAYCPAFALSFATVVTAPGIGVHLTRFTDVSFGAIILAALVITFVSAFRGLCR